MDTKNKKIKQKQKTTESQFHYSLNSCSKLKDLCSAITLYESAVADNTRLNQHHFNTLLYLCSTALSDPAMKELSIEHGFRIFDHMVASGINPNEASITAVARLAAAQGNANYAFCLVKNMGVYNAIPRLRTYGPALFCFCEKLEAEKAYEVEEHMGKMGISLEEPELTALLKVSAETGRQQKVYGYLHKLRKTVSCVKKETAKVIEDWLKGFESDGILDMCLVKDAVLSNGGGWHGLGWIGKGKWIVQRGSVDVGGQCCCCGEQLACVDIGDAETQKFAESVAALAMDREAKANFSEFQNWLDKHAGYEAIIDGANVGLYQQNFAEGGFSISQLEAVVKDMYKRAGNKWPLVILHTKRLLALLENPSHRKLIEEWMEKDVLYATPHGSNDDWYWLFAAVKLRCLLVSNDEMRDHIFELLGSDFFLKWKERHLVHYTFVKGSLKLQLPAPFSVVIQESERGSWHVPISGDGDEESAKSWLCISRPSDCNRCGEDLTNKELSRTDDASHSEAQMISSTKPEMTSSDPSLNFENNTPPMLGKRKERTPSVV
ncbi:hypothetical protein K2173_020657 [Erythroxylum novogranatense]|uniref:ribonuclease P n=1 Tax=Erythroxylum novogranatense TaxID=1862640 RepID=A0AAV8TLJ9_9ROSI|nr:hypothetical protein K2173_020657 [Erythroxylum novogranatense]